MTDLAVRPHRVAAAVTGLLDLLVGLRAHDGSHAGPADVLTTMDIGSAAAQTRQFGASDSTADVERARR